VRDILAPTIHEAKPGDHPPGARRPLELSAREKEAYVDEC
jgi:hypothetical protein